jgi:hypothetical protein
MAHARREVLLALAGLGFTVVADRAAADGAGVEIGRAYRAAHPGAPEARRLAATLLPDGWNPEAEARLRAKVAADFRAGRLFTHRGWRLSETEGALFAALG